MVYVLTYVLKLNTYITEVLLVCLYFIAVLYSFLPKVIHLGYVPSRDHAGQTRTQMLTRRLHHHVVPHPRLPLTCPMHQMVPDRLDAEPFALHDLKGRDS